MDENSEKISKADFETFVSEFIRCLKLVLVVGEEYPTVENTFNFAAKFAVSFQPIPKTANDSEEDYEGPFLQRLLNFCLETHAAVDVNVRYRTCFFMNLLLKSMSDEAFLSEHRCDEIRNTMLERLTDTSSKVRVQAIGALNLLQDPANDLCPIIPIFRIIRFT